MDPETGVLYLDEHGWVIWADTDAAELLRWSVEELVGRPIDELFNGDPVSAANLQALLGAESPHGSCSLRVWRGTGGWVWLRATVSGETHPAFGGLRVVVADVSRERRRSDAQDLLVEVMWESVFVVDERGEILAADPAAPRRLGLSPEFFSGPVDDELRRRFRTLSGEPLGWLADPVAFCLATDTSEHREIVCYGHPDGDERRFVTRVVLRGRSGEARAVVSFIDVRDVQRVHDLVQALERPPRPPPAGRS